VSRLVAVVPLRPGAGNAARELLAAGPPFDLDATRFERHAVYLTDAEAVFVFEGPGESRTLDLPGEDPTLSRVARRWQGVIAGPSRLAETGFAWERGAQEPEERSTDHGR
jgi:hypothetical protein